MIATFFCPLKPFTSLCLVILFTPTRMTEYMNEWLNTDSLRGSLLHVLGLDVFQYVSVDFCLPLSFLALPRLANVKKSIRLREEALAKEQEKATSSQTSAEKLRKILKEEKR